MVHRPSEDGATRMPSASLVCLPSEHRWRSTDDPGTIEKLCIGANLGDDIEIVSLDECSRCGRIGPGLRTTWDTGLEPAVRKRIARWLDGPQDPQV